MFLLSYTLSDNITRVFNQNDWIKKKKRFFILFLNRIRGDGRWVCKGGGHRIYRQICP